MKILIVDDHLLIREAVRGVLDGDEKGIGIYAECTRAQFDNYLRSRSKYYRAEQRWPDAPF